MCVNVNKHFVLLYAQKWTSVCIKYVFKCLFLYSSCSSIEKGSVCFGITKWYFGSELIMNEAQMIYYVFCFCLCPF